MKRIALLIALALIVSVGGVYATWVYSDLAISDFSTDFSGKLSISTAVGDTAKGFLAAPNTVVLTIDDDDGNHIPQWDANVTGEGLGGIDLTFTPNKGAPTPEFTYYITVGGSLEYDCHTHGTVKVFDPVDEDATIPGIQICKGTFEYTAGSNTPVVHKLTGTEIQTALKLQTTRSDGLGGTENMVLESLDEYNEYAAAVGGITLTLYIIDPEFTPAP